MSAAWTVGQEVAAGRDETNPWRGKITKLTASRVYVRLAKANGREIERTFTMEGRSYPYDRYMGYLTAWGPALESFWLIAKREEARRLRQNADAKREHARKIARLCDIIDFLDDLAAQSASPLGCDARVFLKSMRPTDDARDNA